MFSLQKISVSVYIVILPATAIAGDPLFMPAGAAQAGMGYVTVTKTDFWSSFHNQASLSLFNNFACGFSYENRFGIRELGTCSAGITVPAGRATLAGVYSHFGYTDFRRQMAGAACAIPVAERISAGIQIDYYSERTYGEYIYNHIVTFETGVLLSAGEDLRIGIHLFNPIPNSLRKNDLVSVLTAGAGGNLSRNLYAGIETEMTTRGTIDFRTGFEYRAEEKFILRGGFRTMNSSFSFGIGYQAKPATIDIAFASHEKLGITSSVSITFKIKNK